jgi:hypothetical protein
MRAHRIGAGLVLALLFLVCSEASFAANLSPSIWGVPKTTIDAGTWFAFRAGASDPEGKKLLFSISNRPSWASFNRSTGKLTGTPSASQVGTYSNIVIRVSDRVHTVALPAFTLTVVGANSPPKISGTPATSGTVGQAYAFQPTASDPDGQTLNFSIGNKPPWASFSTTTGRLAGTPTIAGTFGNIVIRVTDGIATTSLPAFSISIQGTNRAPTISGTPTTSVKAGQAYAFEPTAADADGDTLKFTIANKPAWAAFDTATGALTGMPSAVDVRSYDNIVIGVTDGKTTVSLQAFSIVVTQFAQGSATLSWLPPTENVDGSPLSDLAGYRVRYGTVPGNYTQQLDVLNPGLTALVVEELSQTTWYFVITAINSAGAESDHSSEVAKTVL